MSAWSWIAKVSKTAWDKFKKLPGWAIGVILLLVAAVWYCVRMLAAGKEIKQIQQDRILIEKDRYRSVQKIRDEEDLAQVEIVEKYDAQLAKLDEERSKLQDEISEGPVGIANAWKTYLAGGSDE